MNKPANVTELVANLRPLLDPNETALLDKLIRFASRSIAFDIDLEKWLRYGSTQELRKLIEDAGIRVMGNDQEANANWNAFTGLDSKRGRTLEQQLQIEADHGGGEWRASQQETAAIEAAAIVSSVAPTFEMVTLPAPNAHAIAVVDAEHDVRGYATGEDVGNPLSLVILDQITPEASYDNGVLVVGRLVAGMPEDVLILAGVGHNPEDCEDYTVRLTTERLEAIVRAAAGVELSGNFLVEMAYLAYKRDPGTERLVGKVEDAKPDIRIISEE